MNREAAMKIINTKISKQFASKVEAALYFGVARNNLRLAMDNKLADIPKYLLDYAGLKDVKTTIYVKKDEAK